VYCPMNEVNATPASNPRSCPHGHTGHSGMPICAASHGRTSCTQKCTANDYICEVLGKLADTSYQSAGAQRT